MFAYAVLFPLILGACFAGLFLKKKDDMQMLEICAFGFLSGMMLLVLEMLLFSRLNIKFSIVGLSLPWLPLIVYGLYILYKNKVLSLNFSCEKFNNIEKTLVGFIFIQIIFVFVSTLIKPVVACDAFAIYSWRAKMFFLEKTAIVASASQTDHPLYNCLNQTWVFISINNWNEILGKVLYPIYFVCLLILFYFALRRAQNRPLSLFATFALGSLPFLAYHATTAYSDFPMAVYYFAAISLLLLWFNRLQLRFLLLSMFFLLSLIAIKSEGIFFIATTFIVFIAALFSGRMASFGKLKLLKKISMITVLIGAFYLFYAVFFSRHGASSVHSLSLNAQMDFSRVPALVVVFGDYLFSRSNWNIIWVILLLLIIFNYKKLAQNFNMSLLSLILLNLFGYMSYYFVIAQPIYDMLFFVTPAVRNILQFIPQVMLLIGYLMDPDLKPLFRKKSAVDSQWKKRRRNKYA